MQSMVSMSRAVMVSGFILAFSLILSVMTEAPLKDLLIGTAAYASADILSLLEADIL